MNQNIRRTITDLTNKVGAEKSICPSEVARALWPDDWRDHMDEVRAVAVKMRDEGEIEITQKGEAVSGHTFTGPIRLRKKASR